MQSGRREEEADGKKAEKMRRNRGGRRIAPKKDGILLRKTVLYLIKRAISFFVYEAPRRCYINLMFYAGWQTRPGKEA